MKIWISVISVESHNNLVWKRPPEVVSHKGNLIGSGCSRACLGESWTPPRTDIPHPPYLSVPDLVILMGKKNIHSPTAVCYLSSYQHAPPRRVWPHLLSILTLHTCETAISSPLCFLFSELNRLHSLSLFSYVVCLNTLTIFVVSTGLIWVRQYSSCTGGSKPDTAL